MNNNTKMIFLFKQIVQPQVIALILRRVLVLHQLSLNERLSFSHFELSVCEIKKPHPVVCGNAMLFAASDITKRLAYA